MLSLLAVDSERSEVSGMLLCEVYVYVCERLNIPAAATRSADAAADRSVAVWEIGM